MEPIEIKNEPIDLDEKNQICRLCLSEESLESVFKEEGLHKWISDFLSIVVSTEDRISQNICAICRIRLIEFQQYRLRCQEVQGVLQARLQDEDHGNSIKSKAQSPIIAEAKKSAPPIQCEVCHKVFIVQRQLADHRRVHRPKNECKWCGKAYVERQRLEKHLKTHENEILEEQERTKSVENVPIAEKIQTVESQEQNVEPSTELEQNKSSENSNNGNTELGSKQVKLETDSASSSFVLDTDVSVRDEEGQDERLSGVDDTIDVEETKIEVRNDEDEADELEPAEVVSYGPGNLPDISEKTQKDDNCQDQRFPCPVCNKMCKSRQSLWCHNKVVHGPKNYPCTVCGFRFVTERDLNYHFRSKRHLKKMQDTHEESVAESTNKDMEHSSTPHEPDSDINGEAEAKTDSAPDEPSINSDKPDSPKLSVNSESLAQEIPDDHPMQDKVVPDHSSNVEQSGNTNNSDSRYVCEKCNRSFNRQCQLKNHMKIHDDESIGVNDAESSLSEEDDSDYGQRASNNEYFIEEANGELQLQCDLCDRVFQERKRLLDHKRHTHGPKNHPCTVCGKPFVLRSSMEKHKLTHQPERKKRRLRTVEERSSVARPFKCDVCQKTFERSRNLIDHKKYIHGPKNHECEICGFRFSLRFSLDMHMQRHTRYRDSKEDFLQFQQIIQKGKTTVKEEVGGGDESNSESAKDPNLSSTENKDETTTCGKCNRTFPDLRFLWLHYKYAHKKKLKCSMCNVLFASNKRLVIHMLTKHKKEDGSYQPLQCEECNKVFSTTSQLTAHKIVHGPRIYFCKLCPKNFSRPQHLKSHMKSHEDVGDDFMKPARIREGYECEICHKVIQLKKHMQGHIRRAHGAELHECSICSRLFRKREELELHLKSHDDATGQKETEVISDVRKDDQSSSQLVKTNDQAAQTTGTESEDASKKSEETVTQIRDSSPEPTDVECGECHKKFLNNKYLYNHIRNVHDPKQYLCSYCGKAFLSSQLVQRHQLTHKNDNQPLHCAKCNKSFPTWRKTYMHMRNHAPKKHKCAICSKAYAQPSHLTQHMASHKKKGEVSGTETNSPSLSKNGSEAESSMTLPETVVEDSRNVQPSGSGESKAMQKTVKRKRPRRKTYSCSICSTKFRSNVKLIQHTETSHQEGSKSNEKRSEMDNLAEVDRAGSPKGPLLLFEAEEFKIEPE